MHSSASVVDSYLESAPLTFTDLGVHPALVSLLQKQGITAPTPVQEQAIPIGIEGRDLVGIAQTGTGKTLAFALPMIQKLGAGPGQALIIVPTRELALQVGEAVRKLCSTQAARLSSIVLIGGTSVQGDRQQLAGTPRIVIATPGRLLDHMKQRTVKLNNLKVLILDEADRMFDMCFAPQITRIMEALPTDRQTGLFSATMPPEIRALTKRYLRNPAQVEVSPSGTSVKEIRQEICYLMPGEKPAALKKILADSQGLTIIFSRTKHGAKGLTKRINDMGYSAAEIHSNRSLSQRRHALEGFRKGRYQVLVATDIAARGIDVNDVMLVVNYDLPDVAEDYVHRIGRTGRAGRTGHAISLVTFDQLQDVRQIEKLMGQALAVSPHSLPRPETKPLGPITPGAARRQSRPRHVRGFGGRGSVSMGSWR